MSLTDHIQIVNVAMDGSEKTLVVPDGVLSVAFHANGGAITIATGSAGSVFWTLASGDKEQINDVNLSNQTFYVDGATGTLEVRYQMRTGS